MGDVPEDYQRENTTFHCTLVTSIEEDKLSLEKAAKCKRRTTRKCLCSPLSGSCSPSSPPSCHSCPPARRAARVGSSSAPATATGGSTSSWSSPSSSLPVASAG